MASPQPCEQTIRETYRWLAHEPYGITELTIIRPGRGGIAGIGFFDNEDDFTAAAIRMNPGCNVYCGIQPRPQRFFAQAPNEVRKLGFRAKAPDIEYVTATVIDIDPDRTKDTASTARELAKTLRAARHCAQWAIDKCNAHPVKMMSGNGTQLWFAIPPIKLNGAKNLISARMKDFEAAVRSVMHQPGISVDSIHDYPRIIKVIGTVSHKGEHTTERPHRRSRPFDGPFVRHEDMALAQLLTNPHPQAKTPASPTNDSPKSPASSMCPAIKKLWDNGLPDNDRSKALFAMIRFFAASDMPLKQIIPLIIEYDVRIGGKLKHRDAAKKITEDYNQLKTRTLPCREMKAAGYCTVTEGQSCSFKNSLGLWPDPTPLKIKVIEDATYPAEQLPASLLNAAQAAATFVQVPIESTTTIALATAAMAIGKKAMVEERPGHNLYPAFFYMLIAGSGERKSPAFKKMMYPVVKYIEKRMVQYDEDTSLYKERLASIAAQIRKTRKNEKELPTLIVEDKIKKLTLLRPLVPIDPRMWSGDATEERLFQLMHEHGGEYAMFSGEGRKVVSLLMGKYQKDGSMGDTIYLAGISGDTITRDRVGGKDEKSEERYIGHPCLNVCIMVQPDMYDQLAQCEKINASGALARIWPIKLKSLVGTRFEDEESGGLDMPAMGGYNALIDRLLTADKPFDSEGNKIIHIAHLTHDAAQARREYSNGIERLMAEDGPLEDMREITSKVVSQVTRLALVLHLLDHPGYLVDPESWITAETWDRAELLGKYHHYTAVQLWRTVTDPAPELSLAQRVLDYLRERHEEPTFRTREVQQHVRRPRPSAEEMEEAFEVLFEHGWIRPAPRKKGERKPGWEKHPALIDPKTVFVAT